MSRFPDIAAPSRFSRRGWIAVGGALLLVMLPSLLLPLGPDQSLFFVSGQKILQGAVHYRDIVDVKPPLIYHAYALAIALFGGEIVSIRIFDLLVQALTCWVMIGLIRRLSSSDRLATLAAFCHLLLYYGGNLSSQAQPESFVGLGGLLAARMILLGKSRRRFPAIGAVCGALFLFKFTFGMMLPVAILADMLLRAGSFREAVKHAAMMIAGFAAVAALLPLYLALTGSYHDFLLVNQFISGYARIDLASPGQWFRNLLEHPALHLSDNYSILLLLATMAGIGLSLRQRDGREINGTVLLRFCSIAFVLFFCTIVVEGKYAFYHFVRLYPFGAILAAYGLAAFARFLATRSPEPLYRGMMIAVAMLALLLFTPIPRYAVSCVGVAWGNWRHGAYMLEGSTTASATDIPGREARTVGLRLRGELRRANGDKLFVASSTAGTIYHEAGMVPEFKIYHFAFVTAPFAPQEWKDSTRAYLLRERPRFIVAETNDRLPDITASNASSMETLRALPGIDSLLRRDYDSTPLGIPPFVVFERTGSIP